MSATARVPVPLADDIRTVQPGGGLAHRLECGWGRLRRAALRRLARRYVARMARLREGACPDCPHDVIDPRDLKLVSNVCGFRFAPHDDRFRWRGLLGVARQGWSELVLVTAAAGGLAAVCVAWDAPWLALLPLCGIVFAVRFFRDPPRQLPAGRGLVTAPADGRVDDIRDVEQCEWLGGPAVRIGIFLSLFDVHLNRVPVDGRVLRIEYRRGVRRAAAATYRVGATDDNEQLSTLFEAVDPDRPRHPVLVRQIAGPAARRIVNELRPGQDVSRGERYGLIKFGSRTELWLPRVPGVDILVRIGQRVRGGQSAVARLSETATNIANRDCARTPSGTSPSVVSRGKAT